MLATSFSQVKVERGWGKDIIHRTEARQERTLGQSQKWTEKKTGTREGDKKGNCLFKVRSDEGPGKIKTSRAQKLRFFKIKIAKWIAIGNCYHYVYSRILCNKPRIFKFI